MLEQFLKKCSLWEGSVLEKFVKDCIPWVRTHTEAEQCEEEGAAEMKHYELTTMLILEPLRDEKAEELEMKLSLGIRQ